MISIRQTRIGKESGTPIDEVVRRMAAGETWCRAHGWTAAYSGGKCILCRRARGRRYVSTTVYLEAEQADALGTISAETRVPVAQMVRDGIDLMLSRAKEMGVLP